jgi:hypothetical protein
MLYADSKMASHKRKIKMRNETFYYLRCFCSLPVMKRGFGSLQYRQGRDGSVGVATGYGLDVPGIEPCWGRDFSQPVPTSSGPTHIMYLVFPGGKTSRAWC